MELRVSISRQSVSLRVDGSLVWEAPVSTSKFGVGETPGSNCTPSGWFVVAEKIGAGEPLGMAFKSRVPTGEVIDLENPPQQGDWILSRILWLAGDEPHNQNTRDRYIYFHGTNEEHLIGEVASHGCIRMRNRDIIDLFDRVEVGTRVWIGE